VPRDALADVWFDGRMGGIGLWVGVLGPLEARLDGSPVPVPAGRQSVVLAVLALSAGRSVSVDALALRVWGEALPARVRPSLSTYVTRLRQLLGMSVIETTPSGYRLMTDNVDVVRFRQLVAEAAEPTEPDKARDLLDEALLLWRGEPLEGLRSEALDRDEVPNLTEERLAAIERRTGLYLGTGRAADVTVELRAWTARYPLRETLWHRLISALEACGRQADALAAYQELRRRLRDELGTDPSAELRAAYQRLLAGGQPGGVGDQPASDRRAEPPAGPRRRSDLPGDVADFAGRGDEVQRLLAALDGTATAEAGPQAVVISAIDGMAGIGKTTLAVHVAHRLAGRYPDGQLFVDLHGHTAGTPPTDPAAALDVLLRAVGVPGDRIPDAVEERSGLWRAELADRRMLVVLDNAASAAQVRPLLPGAAGSLVLVTSRRRLTDLDTAHTLSLDLLPAADALALFTRIVGTDRVGAEAEAAREVVRLCGYLPLAIRIAGARLRTRPAWTVGHLADRLGDARRRLAELAVGDRSVAAAFALSYQHLPPARQRLFRLLGLHPGPSFDARLAAALADLGLDEADGLLEDLLDAHLVQQPAPGRYRLHDLLRDHAAGTAASAEPAEGRQRAVGRLLDYYLHTARRAAAQLDPRTGRPEPAPGTPPAAAPELDTYQRALDWCEAERANLTAVIGYAAAQGWHTHTWHLASALWRFFVLRGYSDDALTTLGLALAAADRLDEPWLQAEALSSLGLAYQRLGRYVEAVDHQRRALALYQQVEDRAGEAAACNSLGLVYHLLGRYAEALDHQGRALALYRAAGDARGQGRALTSLAFVDTRLGRYERAREHCEEAVRLSRQVGDGECEGIALDTLGIVHQRLGHFDQAHDHYRQALLVRRRIGDRHGEGNALTDLGTLYRQLGLLDEALRHHDEALALIREVGDRSTESQILNNLADAYAAAGQPDAARRHHEQALALAGATHNRYQQARAHDGLAQLLWPTDQAAAVSRWHQALSIYQDLGVPEAEALHQHLETCARS
jgi:DNA-binding SARP family transcriptional activator/tetratricopeptide (TPR) repeat protein